MNTFWLTSTSFPTGSDRSLPRGTTLPSGDVDHPFTVRPFAGIDEDGGSLVTVPTTRSAVMKCRDLACGRRGTGRE